jgi:hypothetical protein
MSDYNKYIKYKQKYLMKKYNNQFGSGAPIYHFFEDNKITNAKDKKKALEIDKINLIEDNDESFLIQQLKKEKIIKPYYRIEETNMKSVMWHESDSRRYKIMKQDKKIIPENYKLLNVTLYAIGSIMDNNPVSTFEREVVGYMWKIYQHDKDHNKFIFEISLFKFIVDHELKKSYEKINPISYIFTKQPTKIHKNDILYNAHFDRLNKFITYHFVTNVHESTLGLCNFLFEILFIDFYRKIFIDLKLEKYIE